MYLPPITEIADLPMADVPIADRSLSGLNWPLVSFQCDHMPCVKALRAFSVLTFQNDEMRKFAFGLFNGPDLPKI